MHESDNLSALQAALTNFCTAIASKDEGKFNENTSTIKKILKFIDDKTAG